MGLRPRHEPAADPRDHNGRTASRPAIELTQPLDPKLSVSSRRRCGCRSCPTPRRCGWLPSCPSRWTTVSTVGAPPKPIPPRGTPPRRGDTTPPPPADRAHERARLRRRRDELSSPAVRHSPAGSCSASRIALAPRVPLHGRDPRRPKRHRRLRRRGGHAGDSRAASSRHDGRHGFAATGRRHDPGEAGTRQARAGQADAHQARTREARADEAGARQAEADSVPVTDRRRALPSVDRLLLEPEIRDAARPPRRASRWWMRCASRSPRPALGAPARPRAGRPTFASASPTASRRSLRPVLNATGVVLHTNLGRAPLARAAVAAMVEVGGGYSNLEFDLDTGARGSRSDHCRALASRRDRGRGCAGGEQRRRRAACSPSTRWRRAARC